MYRIDLLRILAMFYVIILHTLGHGGVVAASARGSHQYMIACALEIWAYCAVDLFALISGYVGFRDTFTLPGPGAQFKKYLRLWLEVLFYALVPTLVIALFVPGSVTTKEILSCLFPVTTGQYWYFSAYTGLFLLMPVLNAALSILPVSYLKWLIGMTLVIFSAYGSSMGRFTLSGGYSVIWLVLLYLCGGAVRKIRLESRKENTAGRSKKTEGPRAFILYISLLILCAAAAWLWLMKDCHFTFFDAEVKRTAMMSYTAFNVTAAALLHLLLFTHREEKQNKKPAPKERLLRTLLRAGGKSSFAVYLLNTQPALWKLTKDQFACLAAAHTWTIVIHTLGYAALFLVAAIAVDQLRLWLWHAFLRLLKRT